MRRITIRGKVGAVLALPLVALFLISVVEVRQVSAESAQVRRETGLARSASGPAGVITRLSDERGWVITWLIGVESTFAGQLPIAGLEPTRDATDESIQAFRTYVEGEGGAVGAVYRDAIDALDGLAAIRRDIDESTTPRTIANMPLSSDIYDRYAVLIEGLLDAGLNIPPQVGDAELRQGTHLADMASRQNALEVDILRETVVAALLSPGGIDTPAEISAIATLTSRFDENNRAIGDARGRYAEIVQEHFPTEFAERMRAAVDEAVARGTLDDFDAFLEEMSSAAGTRYAGLRDAIHEEVSQRADELNTAASTRQRLLVILAIVTFAGAVTMTWFVSRSITRPLRSLTRQAQDMADHRLPGAVRSVLATPLGEDVRIPQIEPVTVTSNDEVADVAAILNNVQDAALHLAVEQAVLRRNISDSFLNLGRRNQNLLSRQLDFITSLESQETDPDTLTSLFQLDHLATRMRRNAENLLVLAGVAPPRTWGAPLPVLDIIRAALGEIEDFNRVRVQRVEPTMIAGSAAADLAHLLAELVENALAFSPPDRFVEVRGWGRRPAYPAAPSATETSSGGDDGRGYTLAVIDWGLGMPEADIARANRRLAGQESYTVAPSKYLGHYVAGTLAARHGLRISLTVNGHGGIVANVHLPSGVTTPRQAPARTRAS